MLLATFRTVLFVLLVGCALSDSIVLQPQQSNHQQDSPVQPKHTTLQMKLTFTSPTLVAGNNIRHQMKPKVATPAPASTKNVPHQLKAKVAPPILKTQAYAVPKYTKFNLPNGQQGIKLTDIYHYYYVRII